MVMTIRPKQALSVGTVLLCIIAALQMLGSQQQTDILYPKEAPVKKKAPPSPRRMAAQRAAVEVARRAASNNPTDAKHYVMGLKGAKAADLARSITGKEVSCTSSQINGCTSRLQTGLRKYIEARKVDHWPDHFEHMRCTAKTGKTCRIASSSPPKQPLPRWAKGMQLTVDQSLVQDTLQCVPKKVSAQAMRPFKLRRRYGSRVRSRTYHIDSFRKKTVVYTMWPRAGTCNMVTPCPVLFTMSDMQGFSEFTNVASHQSCRQKQGVVLVQLYQVAGEPSTRNVLVDVVIREAEFMLQSHGHIVDPSRFYIFGQSASTPSALVAALVRPDLFRFAVLAGFSIYEMADFIQQLYPEAVVEKKRFWISYVDRYYRRSLKAEKQNAWDVLAQKRRRAIHHAWSPEGRSERPHRLQLITAYAGEKDVEYCQGRGSSSTCFPGMLSYNALYAFTEFIGKLKDHPPLDLRIFSPGGHAVWRGAFNEGASILWTGEFGTEDWFQPRKMIFGVVGCVLIPAALVVLYLEGGRGVWSAARRRSSEVIRSWWTSVEKAKPSSQASQLAVQQASTVRFEDFEPAPGSAEHAQRLDAQPPIEDDIATILQKVFERCSKSTAVLLPEMDCQGGVAGCLSYRDLQLAAKEVAAYIQRTAAANGNRIVVALHCERSLAMVEAVIGCVLSRCCAVLSIEPPMPLERGALFVERSGAKILLSEEARLAQFLAALQDRKISIDAAKHQVPIHVRGLVSVTLSCTDEGGSGSASGLEPVPSDACFLYFTSGSTGAPRAVAYREATVIHSSWSLGYCGKTDRQGRLRNEEQHIVSGHTLMGPVFLAKSPSWWALSSDELLGGLLRGGGIVLAPPGAQADPKRLSRLLSLYEVDISYLVPSLTSHIIAAAEDQSLQLSLRSLVYVGESLSIANCKEVATAFPNVLLHNLYGCTECGSTVWTYGVDPNPSGPLALCGRPQPLMQVLVLDDNMKPLPPGEVGEIVMGGAERKPDPYFRADEAARGRFIAVDGYEGMFFRSGDMGTWRPDGMLEVFGRKDRQIKIHGARIELKEVEDAVLNAEQGLVQEHFSGKGSKHTEKNDSNPSAGDKVVEALVLAASSGGHSLRLIAFVSSPFAAEAACKPDAMQVWAKQLRQRLSAGTLQAYMVPHAFVPLPLLPRLHNGKTDMQTLQRQAEALLQELASEDQEEVVGSLGAVRSVGRAEAAMIRMKDSAYGITTIALLWAHWLPHNPRLYTPWPKMMSWQQHLLFFATSIPTWGLLGLMMGCEDSMAKKHMRVRRQLVDAVVLCVVYLALGWPRLCGPSSGCAGFATFHRWSCVALAYVKAAAAAVESMSKVHCRVAAFVVALVLAPWLDRVPLLPPRPFLAPPSLEFLIYEEFAFGDLGLAAKILIFYLIGFYIFPSFQAAKVHMLSSKTIPDKYRKLCRVGLRCFCLCAATGVLWMWLSIDLLVDPKTGKDMPLYFNKFYLVRMVAELCEAICLAVALDSDSWILALVGRNLLGTYLVHPYISLELPFMLWGASTRSYVLVLVVLFAVPVAFAITVGATCQWLFLRIFVRLASAAMPVWSHLAPVFSKKRFVMR